MAPRLRIPTTLAISAVGAASTVALLLSCDRSITPVPVDAGRLEKTSDALQSDADRGDANMQPDATTPATSAARGN